MLHAVQSTMARNANARERFSDSDESVLGEETLLQDTDQAVKLALKQGGSPTTRAHDQVMKGATLPIFAGREQDVDILSRIVKLAPPRKHLSPPVTLHALQEWEGYVTEITDTEFTARLTDLTAGETYAGEEADFPLDEISEDDAAKIQVGSIFRWVIGYEHSAGRPKKRVSCIVFRDLPVITKRDLEDGEAWAREVIRSLDQ